MVTPIAFMIPAMVRKIRFFGVIDRVSFFKFMFCPFFLGQGVLYYNYSIGRTKNQPH